MKTIYMPMDWPRKDGAGDVFNGKPTFDREAAIKEAEYWWNHLTASEQKQREIYVAIYTVDVADGDPRTAEQIYQDMTNDDTWPGDWDVIEADEEEDDEQ